MSTLFKHTLLADFPALAEVVAPARMLVDVGAGMRPATWHPAEHHICVEPCSAYADALAANGFSVIRARAVDALAEFRAADRVLMLDVIEHMDREEGARALALAAGVARHVLVYTPYGFVEQTNDAWGMGQHEWQRHRSGWMPEDFPGWRIFRAREGFAAFK